MKKIPVRVIGPALDHEVMEAFLRSTDEFRIAEDEDAVRLLVCDRSEWLERIADAGDAGCSRTVLLTHGDLDLVRMAVRSGVEVFVGHNDTPSSLLEGIQHAARGERYCF